MPVTTKSTRQLLEYVRYPANIVRLKAQEWARYQQRFPAMLQKKISCPSMSTLTSAELSIEPRI